MRTAAQHKAAPPLKTMPAGDGALEGRLLLVSAPWPLYDRPSLALGALKAYLRARLPRVRVDACHLYLQVAHDLGYERYRQISERVWRAEAIYSALLYPERAHQAESLYAATWKRGDRVATFAQVVDQVRSTTNDWLGQIEWPHLDLVGFSISFCQVTASLYLISRIKSRYPALPVVVGGSSFSGSGSAELLSLYPQIDYLITGEGERPLAALIRRLLSGGSCRRPAEALPAGVSAAGCTAGRPETCCQLSRLDRLPVPDYDEYFSQLAAFPADRRFFPTLPVEASRGCWWHRRDPEGQFRGCSFCNLNLQWRGYRMKQPDQVIREVDHLVRRHRVVSLAFADNAFPLRHAGPIFDGIRDSGRTLSIFAELRATTPPELLRRMRRAGVDTVQVGVEALSTRLLARMNKGVRAIDNLSLMKHCEAAGMVNASNLLLHFPSSDEDEVDETMAALDFAQWYRPLTLVGFWLGLGSPVHRFAGRFGLQAVYPHPNLKKLFPEPLAAGFRFMIQQYRGDRRHQQKLWRPVQLKARQWQRNYRLLQQSSGGRPALSFRDGGSFLIIEQHFPDRPPARHRLAGASAALYRFCDIPRPFDEVARTFHGHGPEQIRTFFQSMVRKRLMFAEQNHYLSLAAPSL